MTKPEQRPEGALLEEAISLSGLSKREVARRAGALRCHAVRTPSANATRPSPPSCSVAYSPRAVEPELIVEWV